MSDGGRSVDYLPGHGRGRAWPSSGRSRRSTAADSAHRFHLIFREHLYGGRRDRDEPSRLAYGPRVYRNRPRPGTLVGRQPVDRSAPHAARGRPAPPGTDRRRCHRGRGGAGRDRGRRSAADRRLRRLEERGIRRGVALAECPGGTAGGGRPGRVRRRWPEPRARPAATAAAAGRGRLCHGHDQRRQPAGAGRLEGPVGRGRRFGQHRHLQLPGRHHTEVRARWGVRRPGPGAEEHGEDGGGGGEGRHRRQRQGVVRRQGLRRHHLAPAAEVRAGHRRGPEGVPGALEGGDEVGRRRLCAVAGPSLPALRGHARGRALRLRHQPQGSRTLGDGRDHEGHQGLVRGGSEAGQTA